VSQAGKKTPKTKNVADLTLTLSLFQIRSVIIRRTEKYTSTMNSLLQIKGAQRFETESKTWTITLTGSPWSRGNGKIDKSAVTVKSAKTAHTPRSLKEIPELERN